MDEPLEPLALGQPKLLGTFVVKVEEMPYDNTDNPIPLYVATGWIQGDAETDTATLEDGGGRVEFRMTSSDLSHACGKCLKRLVDFYGQSVEVDPSSTETPKTEEGKASNT